MENEVKSSGSKTMLYVGWALSIIPSLMLILSGVAKLIKPAGIEDGLKSIGWRMDQLTGLGILEIGCVVVYLFPRTAVLGAIMLAAYMGGTVATHLRVDEPFFVQVLVGMVFWLGLWLRDPRLRELLPIRK